ncbi:hypothetical protein E4U47_001623 [Claviceps purpurea]|nr:hypothetical protein E4U38_005744 [Claviceps purpurea]KAG6186879.1 hypothetical protein E4U27_008248 [Claviceps purpurea]KAG6274100.1 hypothetical protein E4U47_001623 [Claviceps purpurea]
MNDDILDPPTIYSLLATLTILLTAYTTSKALLPASTTRTLRFLFIWHLADALCHFILEGSFLYHCFFSYIVPGSDSNANSALEGLYPTPHNFLGWEHNRIYGPQSGGPGNPFAQLWMVYARADRRWAGVDLGVVSLELLTVFFDGPVALYVCYLIGRGSPKMYFWMIVLATAELYGGFMTFCPEWLTGNKNLDGSNFMFMWVYLVFFNCLWLAIPLYVLGHSYCQVLKAFTAQTAKKQV